MIRFLIVDLDDVVLEELLNPGGRLATRLATRLGGVDCFLDPERLVGRVANASDILIVLSSVIANKRKNKYILHSNL